MKTFAWRRKRNLAITLLLAMIFLFWQASAAAALRKTSHWSGWLLLALVVFLAAYNWRKKFTSLPLGSSAAWLQCHIYVGLLSGVAFLGHIAWRFPNGSFERILAGLFGLVFASGVCGLIVSRVFAHRLTTRGPEVLYERISLFRKRLKNEVEELVLECLAETESVAIPEFYANRLEAFFARPRNLWQHVAQSDRPRRLLLLELEGCERYLNEAEKNALGKIVERVKAKDDLDYQFALQSVLKYWLFLHVPLTYSLLTFTAFHVLLVYAFWGGF